MERKKKEAKPAKSRSSKKSSPARKIGYIIAIAFNILFLWIVRHLDDWNIHWITEDFSKCLLYIELSIYATIAGQVLFLLYDNKWFKHLVQAAVNVFGALSVLMLYVIYPFDFQGAAWDKWVKIGLLVLFLIMIITIVVELVKGIKYLINEPEKE